MKKVVQNLKCGGPTKKMKKGGKKFANGSIDTSNLKIPTLAPAIDKLTLAPGPKNLKGSNKGSDNGIGMASDFVSDTVGDILDEKKNTLLGNMDNREDPSSTLKKAAGMDSAKAIAKGTAKGAAIGSIIPGIGTAVGAAAGFAISGLERILGTKNRRTAEAKATEDWSNSWSTRTAGNIQKTGYGNGGPTRKVKSGTKVVLPQGKDENYTYDPNAVKEGMTVHNYRMVPQTDRSYYESANKAGIIKDLSFQDWNSLPKEEKIKNINLDKGYHYTEGNTANLHGIKWWTRDTLDVVNGKTVRSSKISDQYFDAVKKTKYPSTENIPITNGLAKGGAIEGKGTGKSDSVPMKAPTGSFIVPTENADRAEELGKSFLGWDKEEKAKRNNGGTDIKVSDGEVFFTPEETHILKYHGVNLDELAPKAENKIGMKKGGMYIKPENKGKETATEKRTGKSATQLAHSKNPVTAKRGNFARMAKRHWKPLAEGGLVQNLKIGGPVMGFKNGTKGSVPISDWTHNKTNDLVINDKTKTAYDKSGSEYSFAQSLDDQGNPIGNGKYVKLRSGSPYGIDIYNQTTKQGDTETPEWLKNLPELSGALQAAGGAYGLMQAGKTPDLTVSRTLTKLSGEVRKLAEFGYEPKVLNALNTEIENTRRNLSVGIENEGGSGLEKMAKLNTLLSTTIDKKAGLAFANAAEKSRKWADVLKVDTMKAGQEFDINRIKIDDWYNNQEVFAGLVTAGISNIVGARQLKSEQDALREIGGNKPSWTPRK